MDFYVLVAFNMHCLNFKWCVIIECKSHTKSIQNHNWPFRRYDKVHSLVLITGWYIVMTKRTQQRKPQIPYECIQIEMSSWILLPYLILARPLIKYMYPTPASSIIQYKVRKLLSCRPTHHTFKHNRLKIYTVFIKFNCLMLFSCCGDVKVNGNACKLELKFNVINMERQMATHCLTSKQSVVTQHLVYSFQQNWSSTYPWNLFTSLKHVVNNFENVTLATEIATQVSKCNQYMAIPINTLLMNLSQIGPVISP